MKPTAWFLGVVTCAGLLAGCVDRRYVITSDPPGAIVYRNGKMLGATPVDDHFTYYGNYDFLLVKDGYETKKIKQHIRPPWYEYPPLDFFAENLWPFRIIDIHRLPSKDTPYVLEPLAAVRTDELLDKAASLRKRGHTIAPPEGTRPPAPPAIVAPPTPPPALGAPPGAGQPTPVPAGQ